MVWVLGRMQLTNLCRTLESEEKKGLKQEQSISAHMLSVISVAIDPSGSCKSRFVGFYIHSTKSQILLQVEWTVI
jgi:hypothetical protein